MTAATAVFLGIGGLGLLVLVLGLLGTEILHFGHADLDGPVSTESVAGFIGAFGFGAAIVSALTGADHPLAVLLAAGVGLLAAIPAAVLVVKLSRAARDMRTDATPTRSDIVGTLGVVVTPVPADGYGEVRVRLGGQQVKLNARADQPIALGARVFVVEAPTDTSVVVEETHAID